VNAPLYLALLTVAVPAAKARWDARTPARTTAARPSAALPRLEAGLARREGCGAHRR